MLTDFQISYLNYEKNNKILKPSNICYCEFTNYPTDCAEDFIIILPNKGLKIQKLSDIEYKSVS